MTDEQYAVAVVRLVQEATRCQPGYFSLKSFTLNILRSQNRCFGSFEFSANFAN